MNDEIEYWRQCAADANAQLNEMRRFNDQLLFMIREISNALGIDDEEQANANGAAEILVAIEEMRRRNTEPFLQFNLTQAMALVESFGGLDGDMAVSWFAKATDVETGDPMPEGLYAYCYDYPDEGRQWLGDPMAEIAAPIAPATRQERHDHAGDGITLAMPHFLTRSRD